MLPSHSLIEADVWADLKLIRATPAAAKLIDGSLLEWRRRTGQDGLQDQGARTPGDAGMRPTPGGTWCSGDFYRTSMTHETPRQSTPGLPIDPRAGRAPASRSRPASLSGEGGDSSILPVGRRIVHGMAREVADPMLQAQT